jgi:hypothetical protein
MMNSFFRGACEAEFTTAGSSTVLAPHAFHAEWNYPIHPMCRSGEKARRVTSRAAGCATGQARGVV